MKAGETTFLKFLEGKNQYLIPIFQRTYSWSYKQCQQLWDDIVSTAENRSDHGHFTGSVVYVQHGLLEPGKPPRMLIIDGQQRLTTVMLLLAALSRHIMKCDGESAITSEKINDYYLFNNHDKGDLRYKLILTKKDKDTLNCLLDGREVPEHPSTRILENYDFFCEKIEHSRLPSDQIFRGIERLNIVGIALDGNSDNPQLIFESLNSTGIDLSQTDLIRNYILLGLEKEEQDQLYNDYWHPMEKSLTSDEDDSFLDRFIRDYVTTKIGRIPIMRDIYPEFRAYVEKQNLTIRQIIADVYKFSKYYARMALLKEEDNELRHVMADLYELQTYVSYPFLLLVYEDYVGQKITKEDFLKVLRLIESYVFRRYVCGLPPGSLGWIFASLYREIDQDHYLESLRQALLIKEAHKRFPGDEEFYEELLHKDIYRGKNCRYILRKLENYDHKEKIIDSDYTIDHIMPQNKNLSREWQQDLGPDWKDTQSKYLHTIGNLTLTGYNFEFKDYPFSYKRNLEPGGYKDSHLFLNRMLGDLSHWNETTIKERARELTKRALKVWETPVKQDKMPLVPAIIGKVETTGNMAQLGPIMTEISGYIHKITTSDYDNKAAEKLVREIFSRIDYEKVKQVVKVSYGDTGVVSISIGPLVVLKFVKFPDGTRVALIVDRDAYTGNAVGSSYVEPLPQRYVGSRNIVIIWTPWSHKTTLPNELLEAWQESIKYAYMMFKDLPVPQRQEERIPLIVEATMRSR